MSEDLEEQVVFDSSDVLDVAVDLATDAGLLEGIPIFGSAVKIARIGLSVRDRLFLRKVQLFLTALPKIADKDRMQFQEQLKDKEFQARVGETLLLVIERLDSLKKPKMLAKVFAYFVRREIREEEFRRLASAIDLAFVDDLQFLSQTFKSISSEKLWPLVRAGLAQVSPQVREKASMTPFQAEGMYQITLEISKLGNLFTRAMNDSP